MENEMKQKMEWLEAQKIEISIDLFAAAKKHLQFLKTVDENQWLNDVIILERAIYRYNAYWLPLLAKYSESSSICEGPLVPPLDCEWVWHCHRLNPMRYMSDCEQLYGRLLGTSGIVSSASGCCTLQTEDLWNRLYPMEAYDLDVDDIVLESKDISDLEKCTTYDLFSAVQRQISFYYEISSDMHVDNDITVKEAVGRYKAFLYLIKRNQENSIHLFNVPTYDIDLIWHTHQLNPSSYHKDLTKIFGNILQHDDTDSDKSEGTKLNTGFSKTTAQWEETFGQRYWKATEETTTVAAEKHGAGARCLAMNTENHGAVARCLVMDTEKHGKGARCLAMDTEKHGAGARCLAMDTEKYGAGARCLAMDTEEHGAGARCLAMDTEEHGAGARCLAMDTKKHGASARCLSKATGKHGVVVRCLAKAAAKKTSKCSGAVVAVEKKSSKCAGAVVAGEKSAKCAGAVVATEKKGAKCAGAIVATERKSARYAIVAAEKSAKCAGAVAATEKKGAKCAGAVVAAENKSAKCAVMVAEQKSSKCAVMVAEKKSAKCAVLAAEKKSAKCAVLAAEKKSAKCAVMVAEKKSAKCAILADEKNSAKCAVVTIEKNGGCGNVMKNDADENAPLGDALNSVVAA